MGRPHKKRFVSHNPGVSYFKPRGIPMVKLSESRLAIDECEALRLADYMGYSHEEAGEEMGVSRATFGRIIEKARKTVADALINGKAIRIEGGNYQFVDGERRFACSCCNYDWVMECGTPRPDACPECGEKEVERVIPIQEE
ncbi:MAG: DUF134 domain-containing protein [Desulfosalsimonadaceae bacterium]